MSDSAKKIDKIRFRRGDQIDLPLLDEGEPAMTTDTKRLFIGAVHAEADGALANVRLISFEEMDGISSTSEYTTTTPPREFPEGRITRFSFSEGVDTPVGSGIITTYMPPGPWGEEGWFNYGRQILYADGTHAVYSRYERHASGGSAPMSITPRDMAPGPMMEWSEWSRIFPPSNGGTMG